MNADSFVDEYARRVGEKLRPELQAYLHESGRGFGTVLRHPLVYQVPYYSAPMANDQYAAKKRQLRRARAARDWFDVVWLHERPWRFEALIKHRSRMSDDKFWGLARDVWVDSENVWQHLDDWIDLLAESPRPEQVMLPDEITALAELPDPVTVYRGAALELNEDGISWTTSYERAAWFARRWSNDLPCVIHATVPKSEIVMYVLSRNEHEIVVRSLESAIIVSYEEIDAIESTTPSSLAEKRRST